jgi:MFS family permease
MLDSASLFKQRNYVLYIFARLFGTIGAQMQTVAVGWQVYEKSGNPLHLGLIGLSQFAPFLVMILPAGHVADHYDRRRILQGCYALQMVCAVALGVYTWFDAQAVWPVFAVMTLLGVARAFAMPTGQALLPNLVSSEHYARAVAVNATVFQTSTILGPTLGGLLLLAGVQTVYVCVTLCALVSVISLQNMHPFTRAVVEEHSELSFRSLFTGLQFVWNKKVVLGAISLDLVAVLFGGATALLPIYATDILHVGPSGLGMLRSAPGVGAVVCALWLSTHPLKDNVGAALFGSVLLFGASTLMFGASTHFWLSLLALAVLGASDMMSVFVRQYLLQLVTPDAIRGRVSSVSSVFIGASNELGEFESGTTASWWGTVPAVLVGGGMTVLLSLLWMKLFPDLRQLKKFPDPAR